MKPPFGLLNFHFIERFEHVFTEHRAAAGDALVAAESYKCPEGRIALILNVHVRSYKTTSTTLNLNVYRYDKAKPEYKAQPLFEETIGTTEAFIDWPPSKPTTGFVLGPTLLFLFPGDKLIITHQSTAGETIKDQVSFTLIEYKDPRYIPSYERW